MVQRFLLPLRKKGGVVNEVVTRSVAKTLVKCSGKPELMSVHLNSKWWIQSLFCRMGFVGKTATTSKVKILEGAKKEAELVYLHTVVSTIEKYQIPESMVLNLVQTTLKHAPCSRHTLEKKSAKHVAAAGTSYKKAKTRTFVITLEGKCLPFQLIYGGKTSKSLPRFQFTDDFSLSVNTTHFSNTDESLKILQEIIIPYLEKQRNIENLAFDHPALSILDVFKGQLTEAVSNELKDHRIFTCQVPENMTHIFKPLDLTVNGGAKKFLQAKLTKRFAKKIDEGLKEGKELEDIEVKFRLTTLKPLHASWVCELYDCLTSNKGEAIIRNG